MTLLKRDKEENGTEFIEVRQKITILREREEMLSNHDRNPRWYEVRNLNQ